jgi:hypothetical protein
VAPGVAQVARQYDGTVQLIGVPGRDTVAKMRAFVKKYDLGFAPHAADTDGKLWAQLGVRYQPTWIFVEGTTGKATVEFGDFEGKALRDRFDALVAA